MPKTTLRTMENTITISDIRSYAFHGCMTEEEKTGAFFRTDVEIETDFTSAAEKDDISGTVNYAVVHGIVQAEMAVRSRLIENVAYRIFYALKKTFPGIKKLKVRVAKLNPPMNGYVGNAEVEIRD